MSTEVHQIFTGIKMLLVHGMPIVDYSNLLCLHTLDGISRFCLRVLVFIIRLSYHAMVPLMVDHASLRTIDVNSSLPWLTGGFQVGFRI